MRRALFAFAGLAASLAMAPAAGLAQSTTAVVAQTLPKPEIREPGWLKFPDARDLMNYWPVGAGQMGGMARVRCVVTSRGTLDQCSVVKEYPPGEGIGAAALALTPLFLMKPETVDGNPVGGATVIIPINFAGGGPYSAYPAETVVPNPPWRSTPTADEMATAFPKALVGKVPAGRVVLLPDLERRGFGPL